MNHQSPRRAIPALILLFATAAFAGATPAETRAEIDAVLVRYPNPAN